MKKKLGLLLGITAALIALALATCIRRPPVPLTTPPVLATEVRGSDGPVILFLHGLLGSHRYWDGVASHIEGARLVLPDLLGFGDSPKPRAAYSVAEHVSAIDAALRRAAGDAPAIVVGHSMGALLAVDYALAYPQRVRALVLVAPPIIQAGSDARTRLEALYGHSGPTPPLACLLCRLHRAMGPLAVPLFRWSRPDLPRRVAEDAARHTWDSFQGSLEHVVLGPSPLGDLRQLVPRPILIVVGSDDTMTDLVMLRGMAADAGAKLLVEPGDHHLLLDSPTAEDEVVRFIRSVAATGHS